MSYKKNIERIKVIAQEYFEQDNRATAYPIYFTIRDVNYVASYHDEGDRVVAVGEVGDICSSKTIHGLSKELKQYAEDNGYPFDESYDDGYVSKYDLEELDFVEAVHWEVNIWQEKGMFLLAQEAERHLRNNKHHYSEKAHVYCNHAWRSYETEELFDLLKKIAYEGG